MSPWCPWEAFARESIRSVYPRDLPAALRKGCSGLDGARPGLEVTSGVPVQNRSITQERPYGNRERNARRCCNIILEDSSA